jgi:hypothetical protein
MTDLYEWDKTNSVCTHATAKGTSGFLCQLISLLQGKLADAVLEIKPDHSFMGEMLADCFCSVPVEDSWKDNSRKNNYGMIFHKDHHRTDFRMLKFIQKAVHEKLNDKKFVDEFVKEEFYLDN